MGRGKLTMKLIANEKSRKTTFHKRKNSLMKKTYELSTLCDVRTCVLVYGPSQNDQSSLEVHTWPPCRNKVNDLIASYKANCLHKRAHKSLSLFDFFSERKKKIKTDMSKLHKEVAEAKFFKWDERLDYLSEDQLRLLMIEMDSKLDAVKRMIEVVAENNLNEDGTLTGSVGQALNNAYILMKQKQHEAEDDMVGSCSSALEDQTQLIKPFFHDPQYHHQFQTIMAQNLHMAESSSDIPMQLPIMDHDDHRDNLSQYFLIASNNGSFNYETCDPTNNGMLNIMNSTQNYSMCHYGLPPPAATVVSVLPPLPSSYMHLSDDDQIMMMAASASSTSQLGFANADSFTPLDDQFDYINYDDYDFINTDNFIL